MKKKVLSTILAGVLALSAFAGCGSSTEESTDTSAATKEETPVAATEEAVSAENTESTDTAAEGGNHQSGLHPQHRTQRFLRKQRRFLPMRDGIWRSRFSTTM